MNAAERGILVEALRQIVEDAQTANLFHDAPVEDCAAYRLGLITGRARQALREVGESPTPVPQDAAAGGGR